MWKTLTAKSNWLPVAYRLFQGKRYTRLMFSVCVCLLVSERCGCVHLCVRERKRERQSAHTCCRSHVNLHAWVVNSPPKVTSAPDSSHFSIKSLCERPLAPSTRWKKCTPCQCTYKSFPKQEHNFTPLRCLWIHTHFRSRRCTCNYRCRVKNNNYCRRSP